MRYLPSPPKQITLCGHVVPLDDPFIAEQLDREFVIMVHDQAQVVMWLKRAARYFPYISQELKANGLPDDLKYLAVAESSLLHRVTSPAGATGVWQFMEATGRQYGLHKDSYVDNRRNPEKSTAAAIAYLKHLHRLFNSWPLAMAAYNCGERRLMNEMKEQDQSDYFELYLPQETTRYIYRIIAAKIILQNPEAYGYQLPHTERYRIPSADRVAVDLNQPLHLRNVARHVNCSLRRLRDLNPELITHYLPPGKHVFLVPSGQADNFKRYVANVQKMQKTTYNVTAKSSSDSQTRKWVVGRGDTLSSIASKTGVSVQRLRQANGLTNSRIKIGQTLRIPAR
ncbi:transglycosylase SLT domain-containing protein [Desulfosarcina sp. OttesenSCG-928-A07]|nr:transglycosylase SLT domain-containing protein [Desulfosarcina sp. OttesenSCG-928-G17]MDL2328135.1 transglycosylase SLT domain-containing protein [Desulfosarcina sp. OttesenSCG-928-A07]